MEKYGEKNVFYLIITILCNIVILSCIVVGVISIISINKTDTINGDYFINYMKNNNCLVDNKLDSENDFGIDEYLITNNNSCPYVIGYITFNDKKVLNDFFSIGVKDVSQNNINITSRKNISINLFIKYYMYATSGDYYNVIVYKNNSILYASASREYKNDIINIFKDLKYEYDFDIVNVVKYFVLAIMIIIIISIYGLEKKIRNKGWIAFIPYYNIGCLSKDILGSQWYALLLLLPIGNVIFIFMLCYYIAKVFEKSKLYFLYMIFIPTIFFPLVGFDKSEYNSNKVMNQT